MEKRFTFLIIFSIFIVARLIAEKQGLPDPACHFSLNQDITTGGNYMTDQEVWKEIEGYEHSYKVSNTGKIRNLKKELKYFIVNGYKIIALSKNGNTKNYRVHRLVAKAYIPNPEDKPEVNHKDGNKQNNDVSNLEWMTRRENAIHARNVLGIITLDNKGMIGKLSPLSKPVIQYDKNHKKIKRWESLGCVWRSLGFSTGYLSLCCRGIFKKAYGYYWKYEEGNNDE